jgi:hypothetical protein
MYKERNENDRLVTKIIQTILSFFIELYITFFKESYCMFNIQGVFEMRAEILTTSYWRTFCKT